MGGTAQNSVSGSPGIAGGSIGHSNGTVSITDVLNEATVSTSSPTVGKSNSLGSGGVSGGFIGKATGPVNALRANNKGMVSANGSTHESIISFGSGAGGLSGGIIGESSNTVNIVDSSNSGTLEAKGGIVSPTASPVGNVPGGTAGNIIAKSTTGPVDIQNGSGTGSLDVSGGSGSNQNQGGIAGGIVGVNQDSNISVYGFDGHFSASSPSTGGKAGTIGGAIGRNQGNIFLLNVGSHLNNVNVYGDVLGDGTVGLIGDNQSGIFKVINSFLTIDAINTNNLPLKIGMFANVAPLVTGSVENAYSSINCDTPNALPDVKGSIIYKNFYFNNEVEGASGFMNNGTGLTSAFMLGKSDNTEYFLDLLNVNANTYNVENGFMKDSNLQARPWTVPTVEPLSNFSIHYPEFYPLAIITFNPLANGDVGSPYSQTLTSFGDTKTSSGHVFTLESGVLPAGLVLGTDGIITGTPTAAVSETFKVRATDVNGNFVIKEYTITINGVANITKVKSSKQVGDEIEYIIAVSNTGALGAANVEVQDTIPANTTLITDSITQGGVLKDNIISYSIPALAPGESINVGFKVKINSSVPNGTKIENTAVVNGENTNTVINYSEKKDFNIINGLPKTGGASNIIFGLSFMGIGLISLFAIKRKKS